MLRKLKWQIPGEPLAARYNWCQGPVLGRGPAVEKHCSSIPFHTPNVHTFAPYTVKWFYFEVKWSELRWSFGDKTAMYISVTLYWGYLIVLWLFYLVCILCCGCFNLIRNVWVCVCVGFVMCGCVCMCGCFGNMCTCTYCVLYCLYCFCIVSFMYIYSYLFCLYWCKDYCHRVTTQQQ